MAGACAAVVGGWQASHAGSAEAILARTVSAAEGPGITAKELQDTALTVAAGGQELADDAPVSAPSAQSAVRAVAEPSASARTVALRHCNIRAAAREDQRNYSGRARQVKERMQRKCRAIVEQL